MVGSSRAVEEGGLLLGLGSIPIWTAAATILTGIFAGVAAFHLQPGDPIPEDGSNVSVALGIMEIGDRLQLNVTLGVTFATAHDLTLTGDLPDLRRPDHSVGWEASGHEAENCALSHDRLECDFGETPVGDYRIDLVGDACCLCITTQPTFLVAAANDFEPADDTASQTLPAVGCLEGTYDLPFTVTTEADAVHVRVSTPSWFARAVGVELWVDLPPVPRDWGGEGPNASDCLLDPAGDLWCGIGELDPLEVWEISIQAGPHHPCDRSTSATFVLSHDHRSTPQVATADLKGPQCVHHEPGSEVAVSATLDVGEEAMTSLIRLVNNGSFFATQLELWAALPDAGFQWAVDEGAPTGCDVLQRHWLVCDLEELPPFEERTIGLTAAGSACGNIPEGSVEISTRLDRDQENDAAPFVFGNVPDCVSRGGLLVDHVAYHEGDHAILRINVTSSGTATNVQIRTNLPHLGGRWILFGEDASLCAFIVGNDLACDVGPLPDGARRTVELKVYTHSMDCAHTVNFLEVTWDHGGVHSQATFTPPPHKVD